MAEFTASPAPAEVQVQGSLIPLVNGARVLAAAIELQPNQTAVGFVLARTANDYVTWAVDRAPGDKIGYNSYWGHYFGDNYAEARENFDHRVREQV